MKTTLITSQKGGSSKSTLAAHLSVEAESKGDKPVWLIDTDKQATLSLWHDRRVAESPQRADVPFTKIADGLVTLADRGATYCFIETAPTISDQNVSLIGLADLVLIPVRPSPADLWAVSETVQLVKDANKPFLFIITQAKTQSNITAQTVAALSEFGRVAKSFIGDRVAYAASMTSGQTASEISATSAAAKEVTALWKEIKSCFNESSK
jgi:chromosome partitioning protein